MKVVILAGGRGTQLTEEVSLKPKPMVEIGGKPILWHIMKMYARYGMNEFIICCGYKGYMIKEYFANYSLHMSDVTFDMINNKIEVHQSQAEPWRVTLIDTGDDTLSGGRLRRIKEYVEGEKAFCFTYGDTLSDININELVKFHSAKSVLATVTATYPPGRFGALIIDNGVVCSFEEKPRGDGVLINGGFFVLSPKVIDFIKSDSIAWEQEPLNTLVVDQQLAAFEHDGFLQPLDTLRDKVKLEGLWDAGAAPWKTW